MKKKKLPTEERLSPYSKEEVAEAMKEFSPDWKLKDGRLERLFAFKNFREAIAFTNEIGRIVEEDQHYPEIVLKWGAVMVTLGTASKKDFTLAHHLEAEYATHTRLKKAS